MSLSLVCLVCRCFSTATNNSSTCLIQAPFSLLCCRRCFGNREQSTAAHGESIIASLPQIVLPFAADLARVSVLLQVSVTFLRLRDSLLALRSEIKLSDTHRLCTPATSLALLFFSRSASACAQTQSTVERLAEYGWTPHRILVVAQHIKSYYRLQVNGTCVKHRGYGFIEFEISNSTSLTVPPPTSWLSCARAKPAHAPVGGPVYLGARQPLQGLARGPSFLREASPLRGSPQHSIQLHLSLSIHMPMSNAQHTHVGIITWN